MLLTMERQRVIFLCYSTWYR